MKSLPTLLATFLGLLLPAASFAAVPVANALAVTALEDKGKVFTVTATDADPGSSLAYQVATQPTNGKLIGTGPTFIYAPYVNYNGADSFTFTANDGQTQSAPATVSITVTPVAEPAISGGAFAEFLDPNPNPGNQFGATVVALNTGNLVITSPFDDAGGTDAGAVYLFNGATGALISTLTGSKANDRVGRDGNTGSPGVIALSNGNYVVLSRSWANGAAANAGAVTWGNGSTGVSGVVSSSNSLVGSTAGDLEFMQVDSLSNGNYVVRSADWDNGAATEAGAVTWGNGSTGLSGVVSSSNSLVGSTASDRVGSVTVLSNGNFVVVSQDWDNGAAVDAGAVTWVNGSTGISGEVSSSNSLVGSTATDRVGSSQVTLLSNGNYLVLSPGWDNGSAANAGAVTWGNGSAGVSGEVSSSNSLVGSKADDKVGEYLKVIALNNGNYVVRSQSWDNGALADAGAVTWGSGSTGVSGTISVANSLVGSKANDVVGTEVAALSNGNYVVRSPGWDNGAVINAGAVTWGNGSTGISGVVSTSNSLVGSSASDLVGSNHTIALSNGNYVVSSPDWNNGAVPDVGAVTWGNGSTGTSGVVSSSNSLVGSTASDQVGEFNAVTALTNGNYVVRSPSWNNGAMINAGAVTWGNGSTGVSGTISVANSLVGSTTNDSVGFVTALSNGNYVVLSLSWDNGTTANAGAVTWGNGNTGSSGTISVANSLVGSTASDQVGLVTALSNGNYVVRSPNWDSGAITDVGAVTWGSGSTGISGVVSSSNSLVGSTAGDNVGNIGLTALSNGNYVVLSQNWDNEAVINAGAVTWGNGSAGTSGVVSSSNSFVGSKANDRVVGAVTALSNGNYLVINGAWNNGAAIYAGLVIWGNGSGVISGEVSAANSLLGLSADTKLNGSLDTKVVDEINQTFTGRFVNEDSGKVRVGSQENGVPILPLITAPTSVAITTTTATLGGHVTAPDAAAITERGVVYALTSANADPLIAGSGVTKVATTGTTGIFTVPITGLASSSGYSFKGYAINSFGTNYTAVSTFSTTTAEVLFSNSTAAAGLTGADALPKATPFDDGVENQLKYAFNMNLAGPDSAIMEEGGTSGLPIISQAGTGAAGVLCFEFVRRKGSGLVYTPKKSTSLDPAGWTTLSDAPTITPIGTDGLWERVIYEEPSNPAVAPACFGRVSVSLP